MAVLDGDRFHSRLIWLAKFHKGKVVVFGAARGLAGPLH